MKSIDLLITGGLTLLVLGLAAQLPQIQSATNVSQFYSPRTIPMVFIVATLALFAVLLIRSVVWSKRFADQYIPAWGEIFSGRRVLFLVAAVLFVLAFGSLGFMLSSVIFMTVTAFLLGKRDARSLVISASVAVAVTAFVYLVVVYGLESFLPEMTLGG
ncbi:tripartite tricarboxylate transporter TctB family protein [Martelella mediterranea]|uniref:tripartite tricarboxylate transporter TctB family protein n=1 Tax=Martelella mediterranea TaxID=293089 RepID=UPI001E2FFD61|nr:tripartite tricarboxylate transporter TctB family protein [Martelella mediterranea]MCD1635204.1 tripartite tricarboxylate transporter TctB family protein [Martelella mediterranea]